MEIKPFLLGVAVVLVVAGMVSLVLGQEYTNYRCFGVGSEKNLSTFDMKGLKAECNPDVPVKLCRILDIYQIGGKIVNGPMLVIAVNRTIGQVTLNSITWQGLKEVECPENVENLKEEIRDDTVYGDGN